MRFSLASLLLLVAIVAALVGTVVASWNPNHSNYRLFLGLFVLAVGLLATGAYFGGRRFRPAFAGGTLFGVAYLAIVLRGGFGVTMATQAESLAHECKTGFALLGIATLASYWITTVCSPESHQACDHREGDSTKRP